MRVRGEEGRGELVTGVVRKVYDKPIKTTVFLTLPKCYYFSYIPKRTLISGLTTGGK